VNLGGLLEGLGPATADALASLVGGELEGDGATAITGIEAMQVTRSTRGSGRRAPPPSRSSIDRWISATGIVTAGRSSASRARIRR
jgi:hypothetical protein